MPCTSAELRQQRAAIIAQARKLYDKAVEEKRELTAEENQEFDARTKDADKLKADYEAAERREKLEHAEAELRSAQGRKTDPAGVPPAAVSATEYAESVRDWALTGTDRQRLTADTAVRAAQFGINIHSPTLQVRALGKASSSTGGATVPTDMVAAIEQALKFYAPIRAYASGMQTDTGADLDYPRVNDTANGASIVGENSAIGSATDPSFDKVTLKAWKYATTIVYVSIELLQDAAVNVPELLGRLLGERLGRTQATHFTTGNGTTQPQGLATGAAAGVNLITANPLTHDKVIDLIYSVDRAYRANGSFLFHDETVAGLVKLKGSDGQYMWQPSVQVGTPDRLQGYPVLVSNDLTSINSPGDNAVLGLFGDMKRYMIRDVRGSQQVTRLNELGAASGQVGFVLLQRTDGRYIGHSGCVKSLNSYDAP